jgi:plasmid replication initiation protein
MRRSGDLAKRVAAIAEKAKLQGSYPDKKPPVPERTKSASRPRSLLPARYQNRDFFICDLFDYALKDDGASMEAPIFTLSTKPDLSSWFWQSQDGSKKIEVYPSIKGRATQFDKDVLIYIVSQMTNALNKGRKDAKNRTVRFRVHDYLVSTNKPTGGIEYSRLELALDRLKGTNIKTDIRTGGQRIKEGFGIIDKWRVIEKSPVDEQMIAIEVTLSDWLYNAVQAHEVLTIHRDYFRLRKPLERRLYELARKHCGKQTLWKVGLALLKEKCGSKSSLRRFRQAVRLIISEGTIPDYNLSLDAETDQVTVVKR